MKNFIILILLGIIAYLVLTSGVLNRAVQSVPQLLVSTPNPNDTPQISVTVYSPYGTGAKTPSTNSAPAPTPAAPNLAAPTTLITPMAEPTTMPDVPIFVPPTPVVIVPAVPPTLALPNTPTPAANFQLKLGTLHDGDTVHVSPLPVTGVTTPNAVVSVNDVVGIANADGQFSLSVPMQVGPNVLEVIASHPDGQQSFVIITLMYQP